MLHAYWDESGHADDPLCRYVGIGGLVAPVEAWRQLEDRWRGVLQAFDVPGLHMRDFAHSRRAFAGWNHDEPRRRAFMAGLLEVMRVAHPRVLGAVVALEPWRQLTPEQQMLFKDPYFPCLQECVRLAAIHADVHGETVDMTFAHVQEFAGTTTQLLNILRRSPSLPGQRLGAITIADPAMCIPLQLADLVAYEAHKAAPILHGGEPRLLRVPFQAFLSVDPYAWLTIFDADDLRWQVEAAERLTSRGA